MAKYEILLVGDGSHLFRTMAWVLEYKGYAVRTAISPETALEALVKKNYDLVIAKLSTGEADAVDVLKRARRLNPEVKIMVVSGNHEVTFPREAYQIEVDDYILMPVSPTELWRRVSQCLESLEIVDLIPARLNPAPTTMEVNERVLDRLMMMFHDLRGSMVSTAASLRLMVRGRYGEMGEGALGKLHEVSDNVDQLILLTEEFMGKAFSSTGDGDMEKEMLDLRHDVIGPVLVELTGELRHHRITLDNRLNLQPAEAMPVKGSKVFLKSVFRNLVNNGIRHGGDGCTIVIDWQRQGQNCRLNVYNTGQPVPEARRAMLFSNVRKMRRAKGVGAGMGLGLYLSRDIITKHGGDIFYEPMQNGSNFVVTLPQA
ncbi:MAG: hybrid sensor histidine kinase/response regulator [Deltaproteobacteria bacterium]|nr:hybrid sensor histidine kinase/response regulator [Deltaproteobacteria bacterium]